MEKSISHVVIVGGGTAGWLSACTIAARADPAAEHPIRVTVIESPEVPAIGVGEGTWPTIRRTLERIGIAEADFLAACDASFKQGSRFQGWLTGRPDDAYDHPFVPPAEGDTAALVAAWRAADDRPFAETVAAQTRICSLDLAPRQRAMPDYAGALNYAYHLDAVKFAALLRAQATERLGVRLVRDHVVAVEQDEGEDLAAVRTRGEGTIAGDLFIDCTGQAALLIGEALGVPFVDRSDVLPNDRALAVQVPVAPGSPIASRTLGIAHRAGWIWDIGLPTRRGIGCVYASDHMREDEAAAILAGYVRQTAPDAAENLTRRRLAFRSGHRARFWERNCVAIGLSAGFLEPLEASAIVLIELSLDALLEDFPATRTAMDVHAHRFNALFLERWERIVDFLKLHYVLSRREEPYWRLHREPGSMPPRLGELLKVWAGRPPLPRDFSAVEEVFPAASYQYVLYGMGFPAPPTGRVRGGDPRAAAALLRQVDQRARTLAASLPTNRAYLDALRGDRAARMPRELAH